MFEAVLDLAVGFARSDAPRVWFVEAVEIIVVDHTGCGGRRWSIFLGRVSSMAIADLRRCAESAKVYP